jgi:hypothetical protein
MKRFFATLFSGVASAGKGAASLVVGFLGEEASSNIPGISFGQRMLLGGLSYVGSYLLQHYWHTKPTPTTKDPSQ